MIKNIQDIPNLIDLRSTLEEFECNELNFDNISEGDVIIYDSRVLEENVTGFLKYECFFVIKVHYVFIVVVNALGISYLHYFSSLNRIFQLKKALIIKGL